MIADKNKKRKENYISLLEAARIYGCTQKHMALMARQGKLKAVKLGRNWITTHEWLKEYKNNFQPAPSSDKYISLREAAQVYGCTQRHLNLMARNGKLKSTKVGRNWLTTFKWLEEYTKSLKAKEKLPIIIFKKPSPVFKKALATSLISLLLFGFIGTTFVTAKQGTFPIFDSVKNIARNVKDAYSSTFSLAKDSMQSLVFNYAGFAGGFAKVFDNNFKDINKVPAQAIQETNKTLALIFNINLASIFSPLEEPVSDFAEKFTRIHNSINQKINQMVWRPLSPISSPIYSEIVKPAADKTSYVVQRIAAGFRRTLVFAKDVISLLASILKDTDRTFNQFFARNFQNIVKGLKIVDRASNQFFGNIFTNLFKGLDIVFTKSGNLVINTVSFTSNFIIKAPSQIADFVNDASSASWRFSKRVFINLPKNLKNLFTIDFFIPSYPVEITDQSFLSIKDLYQKLADMREMIEGRKIVIYETTKEIIKEITITKTVEIRKEVSVIKEEELLDEWKKSILATVDGKLSGLETSIYETTHVENIYYFTEAAKAARVDSFNQEIDFEANVDMNQNLTVLGDISGHINSPYDLIVSGSAQFAGGSITTVSYSRFGSATTTYSLNDETDLLLSGKLEVDGTAWFDSDVSISNNLDLSGDLVVGGNLSAGAISYNTASVADDFEVGGNIFYVNVGSESYNFGGTGTASFVGPVNILGDLDVDSGTLWVDSNNNYVGIGDLSPAYTLSVDGTASISDDFYFGDDILWGDVSADYLYSSGSFHLVGSNFLIDATTASISGTLTADIFSDGTLTIAAGDITGGNLFSFAYGSASQEFQTPSASFTNLYAGTFTDDTLTITGGNITGGNLFSFTNASGSADMEITSGGFVDLWATTFTDNTLTITGGDITGGDYLSFAYASISEAEITSVSFTDFSVTHASISDDLSATNRIRGGSFYDGTATWTGGDFTGLDYLSFNNASASEGIETSELKATTIGSDGTLTINAFTLGGNITGTNYNITGLNLLGFANASGSADMEVASGGFTNLWATTFTDNVLSITGGNLTSGGDFSFTRASISDSLRVDDTTRTDSLIVDTSIDFPSGVIAVADISLAQGSLIVGDSSNYGSALAIGASSSFAQSDGTTVTWADDLRLASAGIDTLWASTLTLANALTVANGGTGATSLTDHAVLVGSGTGAITPIAMDTNGMLLIGSSGADPVAATLTGTANEITVTNAAGSITLDLPDNLNFVRASVSDSLTVNDILHAAGTFTDGTLTLDGSGNITGGQKFDFVRASVSDSLTVADVLRGGTITDGTATLTGGAFTGLSSLISTLGTFTHASVSDDLTVGAAGLYTASASIGTLNLTNALTVANGGTGATSLTDHAVLVGSGTGAITPIAMDTNGMLLIGSSGADPVAATLTGTANEITVTNAAGSITLDLPDSLNLVRASISDSLTVDDILHAAGTFTDGTLTLDGSGNITGLVSLNDGTLTLGSGDITGGNYLNFTYASISEAEITSVSFTDFSVTHASISDDLSVTNRIRGGSFYDGTLTITGGNLTGGGDFSFTRASISDSLTVSDILRGGSITDGTATLTGGAISGLTTPLSVSQGGTGLASLTDHAVLVGSGTGAITPIAMDTNGMLLIGSSGADPVAATLTGTANEITVTNAAGSITLDLPDSLNLVRASISDSLRVDDILHAAGTFTDGTLTLDGSGNITGLVSLNDGTLTLGSGDITGGGLFSFTNASVSADAEIASAGFTTFYATGDGTVNDLTINTPSNIYNLDHDSFSGFVTNEHIDWTDATNNFHTTGTINALTLASQSIGFFIAGGDSSRTLTIDETQSVSTFLIPFDGLAGFGDVATPAAGGTADNEVLAWDSSTANWINQTPAEAGLSVAFTANVPLEFGNASISLNYGSEFALSGDDLTITKNNLAETGSSILTITGGTNAVLGSGTTIQIALADTSTDGYLSSTDWNTFNAKQAALSFQLPLVNVGNTVSASFASANDDGWLSSTDWSTFNAKEGAVSWANLTVGGAPLTITGGTNAVAAATAITFNYDTNDLGLSGNNLYVIDSGIDHDALTNFVANEHIDWTAASSSFFTVGNWEVDGTASLSGAFSLSSYLDFGPIATPSTGTGRVFYDSGANTLFLYDGTAWQNLASAGGDADRIIEGDTLVEVVDTGDGYIYFQEDGTEYMRLTGGMFGIGDTSPGYKLSVDGTASVSDDFYVGNDMLFADLSADEIYSSASWDISGGMDLLRASLSDWLTVGDSISAVNNLYLTSGILDIDGTASSTFAGDLDIEGDINIGGNDLYVDASSGRVGIGTTGPAKKLHVAGASDVIRVGPYYTDYDGDRDYIDLVADLYDTRVTSKNDRFHVENIGGPLILQGSSGNVGIGTTSPDSKLDVAGHLIASSSFIGGYASISGGDFSVASSGWTSGDDYGPSLYVDVGSGRVGIGTTSPAELLSVHSSSDADLDLITASDSAWSSIHVKRARGSLGSPTIVQNDDELGGIAGMIYDGNSYEYSAQIRFFADGTIAAEDTPGRISFWTDPGGASGVLERMTIKSNGYIGINDTDPSYTLSVDGTASVSGALYLDAGGGNLFAGGDVANGYTSGIANTLVGYRAGYLTATQSYNTFVGYEAGYYASASNNTFLGYQAGYGNSGGDTGYDNVYIGYQAGLANTTGYENVFIGSGAGDANTTGYRNTFVGFQAGTANTTGYENTFVGRLAGQMNTQGFFNTFLGFYAGRYNTTGDQNTFLGYSAGEANTANDNTFIGFKSGEANTSATANVYVGMETGLKLATGSYNTFVGYQAGYTDDDGGQYNTFLGYQAGYSNLGADSNTFLGYKTGYANTTGSWNTFVGYQAGDANTTGEDNTFIGHNAGGSNTTGTENTFLGYQAGRDSQDGISNVFVGHSAGMTNTSGAQNVFIGRNTGLYATTADYNTFVGHSAGQNVTTGDENTFLGGLAGIFNTTGQDNVLVGYYAGKNMATQSYNTFVGYEAGYNASASGITAVGYQAGYDTSIGGEYNWGNNTFVGYQAGKATTGGHNTFMGYGAGDVNTTGQNNTFIGYGAGSNNTTGVYNTFIGAEAGERNTTGGGYNTFLGFQTGFYNTTGDNNVFLGMYAGKQNTTASENTFIGRDAGYSNTTGTGNVMLGFQAGELAATQSYNTFVGYEAGYNASASGLTFLGYQAGYANTTGGENTFIGYKAADANTTGAFNTAVGFSALGSNTIGSNNTAVGRSALGLNTTGDGNMAVSRNALYSNTSGNSNMALGYAAAFYTQTGSGNISIGQESFGYGTGATFTGADYNTIIGYQAGYNMGANSDNNVMLGYRAGYLTATQSYNTFVGYEAGYNASSSYNTFLGYQAGYGTSTGEGATWGLLAGNTYLGYKAGYSTTTDGMNTFIGTEAGRDASGTTSNVYIGYYAAHLSTSGTQNVFIGQQAGEDNTGSRNTFLGYIAGFQNTSGYNNNFLGYISGATNTTGADNIFLGNEAGRYSQTGSGNISIGVQSFGKGTAAAFTGADHNTILGYQAGYNLGTDDDGNVMLGYQAGYSETGSNKLYIDNSNTATPLIYGDFSTDHVTIYDQLGVGVASPSAEIHIKSPNPELRLEMTNSRDKISFYDTIPTEQAYFEWFNSTGDLTIANNDSDIILSATGNVGVGSSPDTTPDYDLEVGNDTTGTAGKPGGGTWSDSSDIRLKKNVEDLEGSLSILTSLRPVTFEWINPEHHASGSHAGLIAQETEPIFPYWVHDITPDGKDAELIPEGDMAKALFYPNDFNAYVIGAFKDITSVIDLIQAPRDSASLTIASSGFVGIGGSASVSGDLYVGGDLYVEGGIDPDYLMYNIMSREEIRERAKKLPPEKRQGAMTFYNGETGQMEAYFPESDQFALVSEMDKIQKQIDKLNQTQNQLNQQINFNQSSFVGNLVNGLKSLGVEIADGVIKAAKLVVDEVKTKILRIAVAEDQDNVVGTATIPAQQIEYRVENSLVEANSKIFISFTSDTGGRTWHISEKVAGSGFTIRLSDVTPEPLDFDYWIVLVEEEEIDGNMSPNGDEISQPAADEITGNICGDGEIFAGEECDDGNNVDGDGCSSTCEVESVEMDDQSPEATLDEMDEMEEVETPIGEEVPAEEPVVEEPVVEEETEASVEEEEIEEPVVEESVPETASESESEL